MTELKTGGGQGYLRIAAEEAFITKEVLTAYKRLIAEGFDGRSFRPGQSFAKSHQLQMITIRI
jgi:hypothetical protein